MLAAHHALRAEVVASIPKDATATAPQDGDDIVVQMELFDRLAGTKAGGAAEDTDPDDDAPRPSRHPWSWLLKRVFAVDVTVCVSCGGKMKIALIATTPDVIERALGELGLGPRAPPAARPAPVGQLMLGFGDGG